MSFSSFKYLTRQGLHSMVKNRLMSAASVGVLTVCLIITGAAALFTMNVGGLMDYLGSQNETIVFLDPGITEEGLADVDTRIRAISGLSDVVYETKEESLEHMKENMDEYADLFNAFEGDENPFCAVYRVKMDDVDRMEEIEQLLRNIPGVDDVSAPVQLAEMFSSLHSAVSGTSTVLVLVLGFVSIVVISNTIRLTVFARRKEINIMKYVGATNSFIRLPFFVEGVAVGLIAGAVSSILVLGGYHLITMYAVDLPGFWGGLIGSVLIPTSELWWKLVLTFFGSGILVGSVGTAFSIRKYMNV